MICPLLPAFFFQVSHNVMSLIFSFPLSFLSFSPFLSAHALFSWYFFPIRPFLFPPPPGGGGGIFQYIDPWSSLWRWRENVSLTLLCTGRGKEVGSAIRHTDVITCVSMDEGGLYCVRQGYFLPPWSPWFDSNISACLFHFMSQVFRTQSFSSVLIGSGESKHSFGPIILWLLFITTTL